MVYLATQVETYAWAYSQKKNVLAGQTELANRRREKGGKDYLQPPLNTNFHDIR